MGVYHILRPKIFRTLTCFSGQCSYLSVSHVFIEKIFTQWYGNHSSYLPFKTSLRHTPEHIGSNFVFYSSGDSVHDEDGYMFEDENFFIEQELDVDSLDSLRVNLCLDNDDEITQLLLKAASVQDVFDIVDNLSTPLTTSRACQAVLTLWNLSKIYSKYGSNFHLESFGHVEQFLTKLISHHVFQKIISHMEINIHLMTPEQVACMLLYLHRLGIDFTADIIQSMLSYVIPNISKLHLISLSHLTAFFKNKGLVGLHGQAMLLPHILPYLHSCDDLEVLKLTTVCLLNCHKLITGDTVDVYAELVAKFLRKGDLAASDYSIPLKIVKFLSLYGNLNGKYLKLTRNVAQLLVNHIHELSLMETLNLRKYLLSCNEPAEVISKIKEKSLHQIDNCKFIVPKAELLSSMDLHYVKQVRDKYEKLIASHLDSSNFSEIMLPLFRILRFIKTANFRLCDAFWFASLKSALQEIRDIKRGNIMSREYYLYKIYHPYMFFNNNLGGTYRNKNVEKDLIRILTEELESFSGLFPSKVSRMCGFLIGYSSPEGFSDVVTKKIIEQADQFSIIDLVYLSRGIKITHSFIFHNRKEKYVQQIALVSSIISKRIEALLPTVKSLVDAVKLIRAYINIDLFTVSLTLANISNMCLNFVCEINSKEIRMIASCHTEVAFLNEKLMDACTNYIIENEAYVSVEAVEKLLYSIYVLGHSVKRQEEFFAVCNSIILRNYKHLNILGLLHSCLGFCLHNTLPTEVIHKIFSVAFLDVIDDELALCYSKATYPARVRYALMLLNRSVCIDCPEENIPWFHEKYCEEMAQEVSDVVKKPSLAFDIKEALEDIFGNDFFAIKSPSSYGYFIDFEMVFDGSGNPVPVQKYSSLDPSQLNSNYKQVAIMARSPRHYCRNVNRLRGPFQIERRHLEMLGYSVLDVAHFQWNSMSVASQKDKRMYLQEQINSLLAPDVYF